MPRSINDNFKRDLLRVIVNAINDGHLSQKELYETKELLEIICKVNQSNAIVISRLESFFQKKLIDVKSFEIFLFQRKSRLEELIRPVLEKYPITKLRQQEGELFQRDLERPDVQQILSLLDTRDRVIAETETVLEKERALNDDIKGLKNVLQDAKHVISKYSEDIVAWHQFIKKMQYKEKKQEERVNMLEGREKSLRSGMISRGVGSRVIPIASPDDGEDLVLATERGMSASL